MKLEGRRDGWHGKQESSAFSPGRAMPPDVMETCSPLEHHASADKTTILHIFAGFCPYNVAFDRLPSLVIAMAARCSGNAGHACPRAGRRSICSICRSGQPAGRNPTLPTAALQHCSVQIESNTARFCLASSLASTGIGRSLCGYQKRNAGNSR